MVLRGRYLGALFFFKIGTLLVFAGDDALLCRGLVLCCA